MVFVFFWELFRFGNERNIIPFILLLIAEWTDWAEYSLLGKRRIRVLLGNFWREIQRGRPRRLPGFRLENVVVLRSPRPWVFRFQNEWAFFWKLKFRVFCYSETGVGMARIIPKECTRSENWEKKTWKRQLFSSLGAEVVWLDAKTVTIFRSADEDSRPRNKQTNK